MQIKLSGGFVIDTVRHELVSASGKRVELRAQALDLLTVLAAHAGEVVDKRTLFEEIWAGMVVTDDSLVQAVSDIRRAILDDAHTVLQTVPRRGYRLIAEPVAPVAAVDVSGAPQPPVPGLDDATGHPIDGRDPVGVVTVDHPPSAPDGQRRRLHPMRFALGAALVAATALAAVSVGPWLANTPSAAGGVAPDRPPIAVLDFSEPGAAPDDRLMARAYSEEVASELARNADLRVIASFASFKAGESSDVTQDIAKKLGVSYLVTGTLRREGEKLKLRANLLDGRDGRIVWTHSDEMDAAQVYLRQAALTQRIAGSVQMKLRLNEEAVALQRRPPGSMDIYAMTLRAISLKHRYTSKSFTEARALLEKVVAQDPEYAPGWVYLSMVNGIDYLSLVTGPRKPHMLKDAITQGERGLRLDPRLAAAHWNLMNLLPVVDRLPEAMPLGERCIEMAPSDSECLVFFAYVLTLSDRLDRALVLARRAIELNPTAPSHVRLFVGRTLWANKLLDEALHQFTECLRETPTYNTCRAERMMVLGEKDQPELVHHHVNNGT